MLITAEKLILVSTSQDPIPQPLQLFSIGLGAPVMNRGPSVLDTVERENKKAVPDSNNLYSNYKRQEAHLHV